MHAAARERRSKGRFPGSAFQRLSIHAESRRRRWYRESPPILRINPLKLRRNDSLDAPQLFPLVLEATRQFHPWLNSSRRQFNGQDFAVPRRHTVTPMRPRLRKQRRRQVQRSCLVGFEDGAHGEKIRRAGHPASVQPEEDRKLGTTLLARAVQDKRAAITRRRRSPLARSARWPNPVPARAA